MDNEIDRKTDVTAILFLLVQNKQQRHDWTLIGSGANGLGIQECRCILKFNASITTGLNLKELLKFKISKISFYELKKNTFVYDIY